MSEPKRSRQELEDDALKMLDDMVQEVNESLQILRLINKRKPHMSMEKRIMMQHAETLLDDIQQETLKTREQFLDIRKAMNDPNRSTDPIFEAALKSKLASWFIVASTLRQRNHEKIENFFKRMKELFNL